MSGTTATSATGSVTVLAVTLGSQTYNDHGAMSVQGMDEMEMEADNSSAC